MGNMTETANYHQVVGEIVISPSATTTDNQFALWIDAQGNILQMEPNSKPYPINIPIEWADD